MIKGPSEEDPLLPRAEEMQVPEQKVTPLPKLQLSILLLLQMAEPMTSHVIYPFVNQLVRDLGITGGDESKVGYYAGLIESLFFATQAVFVMFWSRSSDRVGRKPILLIGLGGLCLSMISFGLSRTFWTVVISRCLAGLLNGNIGVIKSMMGDITDSTNMARGFSFIPIIWSAGVTIGPLAGGILSRPHDRFPNVFKQQLWQDYPYFLPCLFSAGFSAFSFVICATFLKETIDNSESSTSMMDTNTHGAQARGPMTLRSLMTRPVLLSVAIYCLIAFSFMSISALQPLFYFTDIEDGGLGLDIATAGLCLGAFGLMNGVIQVLIFARLVNRFGPKRILVTGLLTFMPLYGLFPVINGFARIYGVSRGVWMLVIFQLFLLNIVHMSFSAIFIFLTSSAPNKRSLGSINGMAQTAVSVARTFGPAASTSLYAFSMRSQWLGGNVVYVVLVGFSFISLPFAVHLPRQPWKHSIS